MPRLLACLTLALALAPATRHRPVGVDRQHAPADHGRQHRDLQERAGRRRGHRGRARHHSGPLRAGRRARARSLLRRRRSRPRRRQREDSGGLRHDDAHHVTSGRDDDASAVPRVGRRHIGRGDRGRRSAARHGLLRLRDACVEAARRRRAGLRAGREERPSQQAGPSARRLQRHDVEQRHVRVRGGHRSDLRERAVLSRPEAWPRARRVLRQHLPQQLRRRPHDAGTHGLRRRRRRDELLRHRRARVEGRRQAVRGSHGPVADATALGARLQPVPLQLLSRTRRCVSSPRTSGSGTSRPT